MYEKYIGKPWEAMPNPPHSYTCGELVRAVYRDMFDIDSVAILANARVLKECIQAMQNGAAQFGLTPVCDVPREFDIAFLLRSTREDHV